MNFALALGMVALAGYALGATPFGYLAGRLRGLDIREHGSKNIGATNVWRVMGPRFGLPVFLLDALKGWLPTWWAVAWFASQGHGPFLTTLAGMLAGMGAVLGHNFTFWLKGRGGKGVATSAGALLGLAPVVIAVALGVWVLLYFTSRYVSLASLGAALAVPLTMVAQMASSGHWNGLLLAFGVALCVLSFVRHKANIARLLAGTELKVGQRKQEDAA
jgi:glycerol-3-phosphate acyltransferase PlsY